ncbi:MAG: hypothetical protein IJ074_09605 [Clostridia bacterium]|nr:hypothetical protein [Clostridia bacterium]
MEGMPRIAQKSTERGFSPHPHKTRPIDGFLASLARRLTERFAILLILSTDEGLPRYARQPKWGKEGIY